jgi:hypothetical protein
MIIDEVAAKIKAKIARKGVEDESTTRNASISETIRESFVTTE